MVMTADVLIDKSTKSERRRVLWHDGGRFSVSLGCTICPDRKLCGGLQVEGALFNCLSLCCGDPADCDAVCRNNPQKFSERVREVDGFSLTTVPRADVLPTPRLPKLVPVLFHPYRRRERFEGSPGVCLPLYNVIARHDGRARYSNREAVAEGFGIAADATVILTGTAMDPPLERWWSLGSRRLDAIRGLCDLGIGLVTTPNFSLFTDQPRWDDLHSMKRIAIVHEEFLRMGLPAALHVNARTDRDWDRWIEYIALRPEVTHIAFEFGTGAGWPTRILWHRDQLLRLGQAVGRPLHLVLRAGTEVLPSIATGFPKITFLETTTFPKTVHRQRAALTSGGVISWTPSPTARNEVLDDLLSDNWATVAQSYTAVLGDHGNAVRA